MIDDDSNFRTPFEALKAEDARAVRPFSSDWEAARQSVGRPGRWSLNISTIAAALALMLIAAVAVHIRSTQRALGDRISLWRSPTASLLSTPGDRLFIGMPRIEEPAIPLFKEQRN